MTSNLQENVEICGETETGDMLHRTALKTLKEILSKGAWGTEEALMGEVLRLHPKKFESLYENDALRIINYGNEILVGMGIPPVLISDVAESPDHMEMEISTQPISTEDTTGKCVDLWDDVPRPRKGSFKKSNYFDLSNLPISNITEPIHRFGSSSTKYSAATQFKYHGKLISKDKETPHKIDFSKIEVDFSKIEAEKVYSDYVKSFELAAAEHLMGKHPIMVDSPVTVDYPVDEGEPIKANSEKVDYGEVKLAFSNIPR